MNFIMKFLEKRFVAKSDYMKGILSHGVRIANLEEKLASQPKISLYPKQEPTALWQNTLMSTTDAVIHCLKSSNGEKLYYKNIYDIIKSYNLINPNVTLQSVKAILYQLARQKRIVLGNGKETGMFFIEKK